MDERLLAESEVAEWLNLSPRTLQNWRYLGKGPPSIRVGVAVRYNRADVQRWIDEQAGQSQPA